MADSTKFNHTAFTRIADIQEIDTIITDPSLPPAEAERYQAMGPEVIYA